MSVGAKLHVISMLWNEVEKTSTCITIVELCGTLLTLLFVQVGWQMWLVIGLTKPTTTTSQ